MKLFKNKSEKKDLNEPNDLSVGKMIKRDLMRILWILLYASINGALFYMLFAMLPFLFSYMYSSIGVFIGIDFSNMTAPDLVFWALISISVGLVFVIIIALIVFKMIKWLTDKLIVKRVIKYKVKK